MLEFTHQIQCNQSSISRVQHKYTVTLGNALGGEKKMIAKLRGKWRACFCVALMGLCGNAWAAFHNWKVNEIYSNASGTVQFIEFSTASGTEQFVSGHFVASSSGATNNSFTFPNDLQGSTANKKFLVATSGFQALAGLRPTSLFQTDSYLRRAAQSIFRALMSSVMARCQRTACCR